MPGQHGIDRRITGFGPGNLIEKWLNAYGEGDINRINDLNEWRNGPYGWIQTAPKAGKYLEYLKLLSAKWPHLQLLADFMEVGTTPVRWNSSVPGGYPIDNNERQADRADRMKRTRVTMLEYQHSEEAKAPARTDFYDFKALQECLDTLDPQQQDPRVKFRLFVVEDLSREVIETLGAHYDVDPSFFREHIADYVWYNIKDWWRDPPNLDIVSRGQNWFQLRFSRARYFHDHEAFVRGSKEAMRFNVYRLLQGDFNHSRFWDTAQTKDNSKPKEGKVGNLRSRATFWIKNPADKAKPPSTSTGTESATDEERPVAEGDDGNDTARPQSAETETESQTTGPVIGILLLDPTIKEGNPLWRQYRNWNRVPSLSEYTKTKNERKTGMAPPRIVDVGSEESKHGNGGKRLKMGGIELDETGNEPSSFFNDYIYWASRPEAFYFNNNNNNNNNDSGGGAHHGGDSALCIPTQALLHLVCTEWLTLVDYIKTRLNQVDWEIAFPGNFLAKDEQIEKALSKLHYWRRVVPVYRSMLAETFLRVFRETKHPNHMHPPRGGGGGGGPAGGAAGSAVATMVMERERQMHQQQHQQDPHPSTTSSSALEDLLGRECIRAYRQDYTLVLTYLEEYQSRIDRLTEVVTAVISIQDSRRGYKDNKNLQWLTWLATFFIPLSFVATMLSMTTGPLDQLHDAAVMWAQVSIPSGLLIMSCVMLMSIARCRRAIRGFFIEFPWLGAARPFKRKTS